MSYSVSGTMITLTRGDTFTALITITDSEGNHQFDRSLWKIRCDLKPSHVGYFCIIPTLWLKKQVITGYFASNIFKFISTRLFRLRRSGTSQRRRSSRSDRSCRDRNM